MSDTLKQTKCLNGCEYSKVTTFCFDCPSLMCDKCVTELHLGIKHDIVKFQKNFKLQWDNKASILELFEDGILGNNVYNEVSRIIEQPKTIDEVEIIGGWTCKQCTALNSPSINKCSVCNLYKPTDDFTREYSEKIKKLEDFLLFITDKLEVYDDLHLEHIAKEFLASDYDEADFDNWWEHRYLAGRDLSVVNEIIEQEGHQISIPEVDEKYKDWVNVKNANILKELPKSLVTNAMKNSKEVLQLAEINKQNVIPEDIKNKELTMDELFGVITQVGRYTEIQTRMIITEMYLPSQDKVFLLRAFLDDQSLGTYIKKAYEEKTVTMDQVRQSLLEYMTIVDASMFLKRDCSLCCEEFPMPEMQSLLTCSHELCKSCFKSWLEVTIETKFPCKWSCSSCDDERYKNIDKNLHYFNLRNFLVEHESSEKILKVFDQKLLNEQIMGSKKFRWCCNDQCEYGFEADAVEGKVQCRICKTDMCVGCKRKWDEKHENISCQDYEMMMLTDDPELGNMLKDIGIECPKCGMRYALAPGGCLHFDCKACGVKFCGSCYELFVTECTVPDCKMGTAFHGHHPRNCLYFLRDNTAVELQIMLEKTDYPRLKDKTDKNCPFIICDKHTMLEKPCNDIVYAGTGLCEPHYREYLVQFINRSQIDPADFSNSHALNLMLFQGLKPQLKQLPNETELLFVRRLIGEVKKLPLFVPKWLREENAKEPAVVAVVDA